MDTINSSYPAFCDHYFLYSFYYDNVTPVSSSDFALELEVWLFSMIGFPDLCTYSDALAISTFGLEDTVYATTGDQFAWTCGYYTTFEWNGDDDVEFQVHSMNAISNTLSALTLAALTAFYL